MPRPSIERSPAWVGMPSLVRVSTAIGGAPPYSSPMSSFHTSGCAAMNASISALALGRVEVHDLHAAGPQQVLGAHERAVLADHHARDPVEQDRAGAHVARREGGVHRRIAGRPRPASRPAFSSASVSPWRIALPCWIRRLCPTPSTCPSATSARTDGDAALVTARARLCDGEFQEGEVVPLVHSRNYAPPRQEARGARARPLCPPQGLSAKERPRCRRYRSVFPRGGTCG